MSDETENSDYRNYRCWDVARHSGTVFFYHRPHFFNTVKAASTTVTVKSGKG